MPDSADNELANSFLVSEPLMCSLQKKSAVHTAEVEAQQNEARKRVRQQNKKRQEGEMKMTLEALNSTTQNVATLAQEKGASAWLG
ncbi:MAG: hypothetical protein MPK75_12885, partial [Alphaproteobacteria bacterium]|nr:hypothetical protein [Alphaproteobacteria bacterium]